jgi:hypothetical protein
MATRALPSPLAIMAAAAVIWLGGCGGDSDQRRAIRHVEQFLAAMEAGDDARACAAMTPQLRDAITTELRIESEQGGCLTRAADVYSPAKAPGNAGATITRIEVSGDRATATVTADATGELATGSVESVVLLSRRGNRWLVSNF